VDEHQVYDNDWSTEDEYRRTTGPVTETVDVAVAAVVAVRAEDLP